MAKKFNQIPAAPGVLDTDIFPGQNTIISQDQKYSALQLRTYMTANLTGALIFKGSWNADTNTPALSSGVGTQGDAYRVSVAGDTTLDGSTDWEIGDWAVFDGTIWNKFDNTDRGIYDAVVGGSHPTHLSLKAAVDAGASRILMLSSTTETGDITFTASFYQIVSKPGTVITMGNNKFAAGANSIRVEVEGGDITYAHTASVPLFDFSGFTGGLLDLNRASIQNNSTITGAYVHSDSTLVWKEGTLTLPNQDDCGLHSVGSNFMILDNIIINGGGAACSLGVNIITGGFTGNRIFLGGTWSTTNPAFHISTDSTFNNVLDTLEYIGFANPVKLELGGSYSNIVSSLGEGMEITVVEDRSSFTSIVTGSEDFIMNGSSACKMVNSCIGGELDLSDVADDNNLITNVEVMRSITVAGSHNCFTNLRINPDNLAGVTVEVDGDENSFSNIKLGTGSTPNSTPFNINASAFNTQVTTLSSNDSLNDSGTATSLANIVGA